MPTYGDRGYLKDAVKAILSQDYDDFELIIKDGAKDLKIFDTLKEFLTDKRVKLIFGKDRGITDAMNQAMLQATGDIICWANDDDLMSEGTLKFVVENIGNYKWMYGKIEMFDDRGNILLWGSEFKYSELKKNNYIPQPAVFWKAEAVSEIGIMDETNDLVSDYEYWLRLGSKFNPLFVDRVMARYRIHDGQITIKDTPEQLRQAENVKKIYENTYNGQSGVYRS
jgi:glycosyltransferase involved in cell wall biosynthesis